MVSELPSTVGFVQGLRYDMIQYRKKCKGHRKTMKTVFQIQGHCKSVNELTSDSSVKPDMKPKQFNRSQFKKKRRGRKKAVNVNNCNCKLVDHFFRERRNKM